MFRENIQQAVAVILARDGGGQNVSGHIDLVVGNGGHSSLTE